MLKGNLVVGQSGGPTAVINNSLLGVIKEAMLSSEIEGIYGMLHGIMGFLNEEFVDLRKESSEVLEGLRTTPSAALGSCRYKLKEEDYPKILKIAQKYNIRYFFYIGGNDSMDTSHKIGQQAKESGFEMRIIGIPKTVDNDLAFTDHCPGYGSVARFIATATQDAGRDTEAIGVVDKIKVIEAMGRNAGWITAASVLGKRDEIDAPHLVYLPERPLNLDKFLEDVNQVYQKLGYGVIVVCEGVKGEDGEPLVASGKAIDVDAFGHKQMGGVADYLCKLIAEKLKLKARFDKPGTIQRMSQALVSKTDAQEAYAVGQEAVRKALEGVTDKMITLERLSDEPYECKLGVVDLDKVANVEKVVPDEFIGKEGNSITEKFLKYAQPLIGEPLAEYVRLKKVRVEKK
jgi:6-phosphofructokinase 1